MSNLQIHAVMLDSVQMGFEIQRRVLEGWKINPDNPLTAGLYGSLQVEFIRDPADAHDPEPKLSRAEILANARAVKAAKKLEQQGGTEE